MGSSKKRKPKQHKCSTPGCRRRPRLGHRQCSACNKQEWRKKNPMKAAYSTLKDNATRRGIFFDLTFEQFATFCYETNYMAGKGRSSTSYSIDRKIEGKLPGYTFKNMEMLPKGINTQKEHARRKNKVLIYDWETKTARVVDKTEDNNEKNPF